MNSYGELINTLPDEGKKLIRIRESTIKKIINAELSITFNETCIRENLLPTYTLNIYIYGHFFFCDLHYGIHFFHVSAWLTLTFLTQ